MWPEYRCRRYVFRVYENTGSGFAEEPKIVYAPIPLETDRGTSNLGAGHLAASSMWHGFVDMDGDGLLDAVYKQLIGGGEEPYPSSPTPLSQLRPIFQVFRGDGKGNFRGDAKGNPYQWQTPALYADSTSTNAYDVARVKLQGAVHTPGGFRNIGTPEVPDPGPHPQGEPPGNVIQESFTKVTLQDVNGDGLPDYVDSRFKSDESFDATKGHVHVFYNTGTGFESPVVLPGFRGHKLETPAWGTEVYPYFEETAAFIIDPQADGVSKKTIWSRTLRRAVDIDADGLLDMVLIEPPQKDRSHPWALSSSPFSLPPQPPVVRIFVNVGDKLVPMGQTDKIAKWWPALARITLGGTDTGWSIATDFIDLDGDGLPEVATGTEALLVPNLYSRALPSCLPDEDLGI